MTYRKTIEAFDLDTQDMLSAVEHLLSAVCFSGQHASLERVMHFQP
jgi:hypothetical protein